MTIEELMINFNTNNWSNVTILILKISMEYYQKYGDTEINAKNLMKFKLRSILNDHYNLDQIYI